MDENYPGGVNGGSEAEASGARAGAGTSKGRRPFATSRLPLDRENCVAAIRIAIGVIDEADLACVVYTPSSCLGLLFFFFFFFFFRDWQGSDTRARKPAEVQSVQCD